MVGERRIDVGGGRGPSPHRTKVELDADRDMIRVPAMWPLPVLPLKRHGDGMPDLAVLTYDDEGRIIVHVGANLFGGEASEVVEYASPDAVVYDGWVVD